MRLVLMGDFHYSRMENGSEEMLESRDHVYTHLLRQFLGMDGDLHISLGDLTHEGHPEEFRYVFNRIGGSGRPFIHALGNHDTYLMPKADIAALTGQRRYRSMEMAEATLIFLDTTREMDRDDWGGTIDAEQLEWLRIELERAGTKPVLVFAHHPVFGTTARSTLDKLSIHPSVDIQAVLNRKQGRGFYFCGHNHVNSIVRQGGWHFIQTAACLDIPAFRTVELTGGQLHIGLVSVLDAALPEHIARFHANMPGFRPNPEAQGSFTDWSLQVDLLQPVT